MQAYAGTTSSQESPTPTQSSAWRIAPPLDRLPQDRMVRELSEVPKGALRTVFGKALGKRIWEQARRPRPVSGEACGGTRNVTDSELFVAMIESISRRAADTLAQNRRQAKAIGLNLTYSDGSIRTETVRLARPSADAREIASAAVDLFRQFELSELPLVSINLTTATVHSEAIPEADAPLACAMAPSTA